MSPADYLEIRQLGIDGAAAHSMNAVSILFAYLVAMYFGAKRLSRFQVASVTAIYSVFILFPIMSTYGGITGLVILNMEFLREHPEVASTFRAAEAASLLQWLRFVELGVFFLAWLLSILFVVSLRKDWNNGPVGT